MVQSLASATVVEQNHNLPQRGLALVGNIIIIETIIIKRTFKIIKKELILIIFVDEQNGRTILTKHCCKSILCLIFFTIAMHLYPNYL